LLEGSPHPTLRHACPVQEAHPKHLPLLLEHMRKMDLQVGLGSAPSNICDP